MKFFVLATFFVVGLWTGAAYGEITIPSDAKVVYGGKMCQSDGSPADASYRKSTNTLYYYSCDRSGRVVAATDRVINRTIDNTARQVESSVQHGINRQISDLGYKLDKIFGRY